MLFKGMSLSQGYEIGEVLYFDKSHNVYSRLDKGIPSIIVASTLTPKDTIGFRNYNIVALVVEEGSPNSHVSILARVMDIPAIVVSANLQEWDSKTVIVDGFTGEVVVDPDEEDMSGYWQRKDVLKKEKLELKSYKGKITQTKSGRTVKLYANITSDNDVDGVLANDAEGIGNFKTEFLYLETTDFPSEETQFEVYRNIAKRMNGKKVVIRTLDIGADKTPDYFNLPKEDNPALGYRAIRICLDQLDIFVTQIRAILRASVYGNVSIMYPMISSEEEVVKIKHVVKKTMQELSQDGILYNENIEQGIMIETPASVIISRELAKLVDFFSIGTNDLTQYVLAADRTNQKLNDIVDPYHPSILWSLKHVIKNAHAEGIWVSVSGELAADLKMTKFFLENGLDAFTVSPNKILELRKEICESV